MVPINSTASSSLAHTAASTAGGGIASTNSATTGMRIPPRSQNEVQDQEQDKPQVQRQEGPRPWAISFQDLHTAPEAVPEVLLLIIQVKNTSMVGMPIGSVLNTTASTRPSLVTGRGQLRHDKINGFYPGKQAEQQNCHHQEISKSQGKQLPVPFLPLIKDLYPRRPLRWTGSQSV